MRNDTVMKLLTKIKNWVIETFVTNSEFEHVSDQTAINATTIGFSKKNLLEIKAKSTTTNGITFTVNDDKSVTIDGTAKDTATFILNNTTIGKLLKNGKYILSGVQDKDQQSYFLRFYNYDGANHMVDVTGKEKTVNFTNENGSCNIAIVVWKDAVVNNISLHPMLRPADIKDDTFEPYTPSLQEQINSIPVLKSMTITETTTMNGNIGTGLDYRKCAILQATTEQTHDDHGIVLVPMKSPSSMQLMLHVMVGDPDNTILADTSVTATIYYYEI